MLIICPDCESSYEVEAAAIGPAGRKVRCTECGAVWLARQAESSAPEEPAETPAPEPAAAPALAEAEEIDAEAEEVVEAAAEGADRRLRDADFAAPAPIEAIISNPALQEAKTAAGNSRRRPRGTAPRPPASRRALVLAAALGLAVFAVLVLQRKTVVSLVPDLAGLYEAAGLPVNLRGLEFEAISTQERVEDGVPQLAVRGTIRNVSEEAVPVPRLRLAVRDRGGREIFVWTAMPARSELAPGERLPFFAQIASPPADGREVTVRFVGARDAMHTAAR